jgi:hypothetical protein
MVIADIQFAELSLSSVRLRRVFFRLCRCFSYSVKSPILVLCIPSLALPRKMVAATN